MSRIGSPEVLEVVVSEPPKGGEVLVDVEAAGINYVDVYQRQGDIEMLKPYRPGLEGVGIVRAVPPGKSPLKAGQRIAWINTLDSYGWSRDLGTKGITVNTVQPGPIATEMNPDSGDFAEMLKGISALRRYGKPEEIAVVVAFPASPSASYITGSTLTVDGGVSA